MAAANSDFAFDLYRKVRTPGENLLLAPYGVSTLMAMIYAGARGTTKEEIATVMRFNGDDLKLHRGLNYLDLALRDQFAATPPPNAPELNIINGVWVQKGRTWSESYLDLLKVNYGSGITAMDFLGDLSGSVAAINKWAEFQTQGIVSELLDPEEMQGVELVIANAIYFKGDWVSPFLSTSSEPFQVDDGKPVIAPFMKRKEMLQYGAGEDYRAVALPYQGGTFQMVLMLPQEGGLAALEEGLTGARLREIVKGLTYVDVALSLPRFEFAKQTHLDKELAALGMPKVFSVVADLSGITDEVRLYLQFLLQEAYVKVDEVGTKATAVTVTGVISSVSLPNPIKLTFDRPFLFVIQHIQTQTTLFVGRVSNPLTH